MEPPKIVQRMQLAPVKATLKTLHELACRHAEQQFRTDDDDVSDFSWLIGHGTQVFVLVTNWGDEAEKARAVSAVRDLMQLLQAHIYSQISEAWMACVHKNTDALDKMLIEDVFKQGGSVMDLPARLRRDGLIITTQDEKGDYAMTRFEIETRGHRRRLLEREDVGDYLQLSGRMTSLLAPDPEADRELARKLKLLMQSGSLDDLFGKRWLF